MSHTYKRSGGSEPGSEPSDRLINLFAALAQGVSDRVRGVIAEAFPSGGETAAALIVIGHEPGLSIEQISRILRLSHAGAVRLVDRLMNQGWAAKSPSRTDRRVMHVALTAGGQAQRDILLELRRAAVSDLLAPLASHDHDVLERLAGFILAKLPGDALSALTTCRFCDEKMCTACPMGAFGSIVTSERPDTSITTTKGLKL